MYTIEYISKFIEIIFLVFVGAQKEGGRLQVNRWPSGRYVE